MANNLPRFTNGCEINGNRGRELKHPDSLRTFITNHSTTECCDLFKYWISDLPFQRIFHTTHSKLLKILLNAQCHCTWYEVNPHVLDTVLVRQDSSSSFYGSTSFTLHSMNTNRQSYLHANAEPSQEIKTPDYSTFPPCIGYCPSHNT